MATDFASSDAEAKEKYSLYENKDPFPAIPPALLNSADIADYVRLTGMIHPFYPEDLKPASYGIKLKGEFIYWLTPEKRIHGWFEKIEEKDSDGDVVFTLKKNSIAFVQLEPDFKLPSYLAARFDLKIKHIYQGILLGTGPLVDPGYVGNLFVPLHNLTNNDYQIKIKAAVIWMEFTKLTPNVVWDETVKSVPERIGTYIPFGKNRSKKTLADYINDAFPNAPIISTIPGILSEYDQRIKKSEASVKETVDSANKATTSFNRAILVAMIGIFVTLIFQVITMHSKNVEYIKDNEKRIFEDHSHYLMLENENKELMKRMIQLEEKIRVQDSLLKTPKKKR